MIYGYLRVSSDEQDVNSQKQGVEKFAEGKGWTIDEFITDEGVSGGKDPDKRNLGPLLKKLQKGDIVIASEISRLGRDLYMVMDILHFCMERECVIHTVKDRFTLGDDIQSKVLAFAFGLAAEIERQMIRQRTKEGLKLRMKMGVLLGRPCSTEYVPYNIDKDTKADIIRRYEWGVPVRRLARDFKIDRNTMARYLAKWNVKPQGKDIENLIKERRRRREKRMKDAMMRYKDSPYSCVTLERSTVTDLIEQDLTIPQIAERMPQYTYEQIYDTILCDAEWNSLYRKHGQLKVRKPR